jgi:hypothetical protein
VGNDWTEFRKAFGKLAYEPRTEEDFEREWAALCSKYPLCTGYLNKELYPARHLWAWCWVSMYTTFGARSTQRVESINRVVKHFQNSGIVLDVLFKTVIAISDDQESKRKARLLNDRHTNHWGQGPVYEAAIRCLTRPAAEFVSSEFLFSSNYQLGCYNPVPLGVSADPKVMASSVRIRFRTPAASTTSPARTANELGTSSVRTSYVPLSSSARTDGVPQPSMDRPDNESNTVAGRTDDVLSTQLPHTVTPSVRESAWAVWKRDAGPKNITHWVQVQPDRASCTDCPFNSNWLLPCRHILAVMQHIVNSGQSPMARGGIFRPEHCHSRWKLEDTTMTRSSLSSMSRPLPSHGETGGPEEEEEEKKTVLTGMSKDAIALKWKAEADRVIAFIQPLGEDGLNFGLLKLNELMASLAHYPHRNANSVSNV